MSKRRTFMDSTHFDREVRMSRRIRWLVGILAAAAGCSGATSDVNDGSHGPVTAIEGPLTLVLTDVAAVGGFSFALPAISGGTGSVSISSLQYGSLCRNAVSAHASTVANHVTIRVTITERTAADCPAEIRALSYQADVEGLAPGSYDVDVVHVTDATPGGALLRTLQVQVR
jgi:hypothetical protein